MFQFPGYASHSRWALSGCPIRKSADLSSFAAPRSLSQLYTSFIASACQGIHRVPLSALFIELARPVPRRTARAQLQGFYCGLDVGRTASRYLWRIACIYMHTILSQIPSFDRIQLLFTHTSSSCQRTRWAGPGLCRERSALPGYPGIVSIKYRALPPLTTQSPFNTSKKFRGATGIRTPDPLLAKQVL